MSDKKKKKAFLNMRLTLLLVAIVPMLITVLVVGMVTVNTSSKDVKDLTHHSLVALMNELGEAFDKSVENSEQTLQNFIQAPIVTDYLKNPEDPDLAAKAQAYTADFFDSLSGWEGIYIADWNSKVLTHPAPSVVGRVMREGDRLKELQDAMLAADGVYNVGIIESPASGELIISMYLAVYDTNGKPLGYVGAGTFVTEVAKEYADCSKLGIKSAYVYYVDKDGIMFEHPSAEKIGKAAENAAVKSLIAQMSAGQYPEPNIIEYNYKGELKYAAYYIGFEGAYVGVLSADESDVLSDIRQIQNMTILVGLICALITVGIAFLVASLVAKPLAVVAKATEALSTGDVTVSCNVKSSMRETSMIVDAFGVLKGALQNSLSNVKSAAGQLDSAIVSVDEMTGNNVDSVTQINNAIGEVASTSQAVAEDAQTMAERAAELGKNVEQLNDNVERLFDASKTIKEVNGEATECMQSVYNGANESVHAMETIHDKIGETNRAIESIHNAVQAIESIASQTNLLSLNASIEAARAGEAGAGFAVVAGEIRTLADSSAESAKEIRQIIENVIGMSHETVAIANRVFEVINKEQQDIEVAQEKFNVLSASVEASIEEINVIQGMTVTLDSIKTELANATTDLGAISEELGAAAEEVAASCTTVTTACTDTQASTEEMRAINEHMSEAIDFFKLN